MALFDALCHLYLHEDPNAALRRARQVGVVDLMLAGFDPNGWQRQRSLAADRPELHLAFGVHPRAVDDRFSEKLAALTALIQQHRPVALGEIGLDRLVDGAALAVQQQVFDAQLQLSRQEDLPVILHVVRAHGHALEQLAKAPPPSGVVHGFSGASEVAQRYLRLGLMVSFGPMLLNPRARKIREAAKIVPLSQLLVETDAPDQIPEASALPEVVAALAALRGISVETLAEATAENARRVYRLP
ncbi:MAG: TatD family hydrolase [Myxococcota bacterium]